MRPVTRLVAAVLLDADKNLVISNRRYQEMYRLPDELVLPGTPLNRILQYYVDRGETDDLTVDQHVQLMSTTLGQDYISGRLYAVDRDRLAAIMARRGLIADGARPRLPTDLVTEDSWLTAVVAEGALAVVPEAPIHYGVEGFADVIRVLARNGAAREQLRSEYPALYRSDANRLLSARSAAQILGRG